MKAFLARIPYPVLIPGALLLGLAPFYPQPHAVEKIRMLVAGSLHQPIDIFDLLMHLSPVLLLMCKWLVERFAGRGDAAR
ncbi:RND transporter [Trichloromonas sp.]|uniref:RND transporter n=1 Tax=Trichloromonas sp. TaxID=3069249 RepID=UPI003D81888A